VIQYLHHVNWATYLDVSQVKNAVSFLLFGAIVSQERA